VMNANVDVFLFIFTLTNPHVVLHPKCIKALQNCGK
jgi:hypothetical protein